MHNEIDDLASLEAVCRQGADFGFDGKSVIHPSHLEICNLAFTPAAGDIAWATAVIAAFDAPEDAGRGALRVEGQVGRAACTPSSRLATPAAFAEAIAARAF